MGGVDKLEGTSSLLSTLPNLPLRIIYGRARIKTISKGKKNSSIGVRKGRRETGESREGKKHGTRKTAI